MAGLLLVGGLAGCGGDEQRASCADPTPVTDTGSVLAEMDLGAFGTVTAAVDGPGLSTATVVSGDGVQELVDPVRSAILAAGYTILAEENEGFEADFLINRGSGTQGVVRITDTFECDVRRIQVSVADTRTAAVTPTPVTPTASSTTS